MEPYTESFPGPGPPPTMPGSAASHRPPIGNTDWSIMGGQNIADIRCDNWVTPVPFELDYSELVNAPYAVPPSIRRGSVSDGS